MAAVAATLRVNHRDELKIKTQRTFRMTTGLERIELERLRERLGRLFTVLDEAAEVDAPPAPGRWLPPVDLCETETGLVVSVELPGVAADQVSVILSGAQLHISGEKNRRAQRRRGLSHLCSERSYGRFDRTLHLRWTISAQDVTAEMRNGVLVVRLPKLKERRGTTFKVTVKETENDER